VRTHTFVGSREVVVVLGRWRDWTRVRYARLGTQVGWVPTRVLWPSSVSNALITVDRHAERLRAYRDGKLKLSVRVAVGAPSSPTPAGRFYLRERVPASGVYGPLALGLSAFSRYRTDWLGGGQVAIHGTNEPQLIPGRVSNGCVRLHNRDIRRLGRIAGVGTPVRIR
jgi:lipoprotein-anchoring transpeptidase ErfK/SrfK